MAEVVTLEEKRFVEVLCEGVGKATAEILFCAVSAAFAKIPVSLAGDVGLIHRDRHQLGSADSNDLIEPSRILPGAMNAVRAIIGRMRASNIAIIGAPMDLGAGRRGVDMGPSALRVAGLNDRVAALGYEVSDLGNVTVDLPETAPAGHPKARYLPQISQTCERLAGLVEHAMQSGQFPLVLGGDHSIAMGTIAGISKHFRSQNKKIGLIWIDAHADMNTPDSSPTGNVHGMPLACVIGQGPRELAGLAGAIPMVDPANVSIIGLRSVDEIERLNVRGAGVHPFTMRDIDERGLRAVVQEAISHATRGTAGFHLSFDMDSVDPSEAPGVGTPVAGGITYREAHLAMELICDSGQMTSLELVEVNPVMDVANRTASLGVELVMSALGKRIL